MSAAATRAPGDAGPPGSGLAVLAVVAIAFAYQLPFFDRWFSAMDEGHILLYADFIAQGGDLYRDATVYPLPGAFFLLALAFKLFEPSNLVARWIMVAEFALFVGLVFVLLRRMLPLGWALGGVALMLLYRIWAFPHWHMYSYSTTALLVQLSTLLVLLGFTRTGRRWQLALAGLLYGLGVLCKQDYGAAVLVVCLATLALHVRTLPSRPRITALFACFIVPAALVGAATALYFIHANLFGDFLRFTVLNHFVGMSSYEYSTFPSLFPLFQQDPDLRSVVGMSAFGPAIVNTLELSALLGSPLYRETALYDTALKLFYYGPYPLLALAALRLWRRRRDAGEPERRDAFLAEFVLCALAAALFALAVLNRPQDYVHLVVLYWPLVCLGLVQLHALVRGRRALALALAVVLAAPAVVAVDHTAGLALRLRNEFSAPIASERAGIRVRPKEAQLLDELVRYVKTRSQPDETVAIMPYLPYLHFLTERRGPHRSAYIVWPFPELPDRDRRVIDAMEASDTKLLIYMLNEFQVFEGMRRYAPELFAYLVENFEIEKVFNNEILGYRIAAARRSGRREAGRPLSLAPDRLALSVRAPWTPERPVPPEEWSDLLSQDLWPFREVVTLRPTRDGRTVLSVPATIREGERLVTAVGIHPDRWDQPRQASVDFEVAVVDGERREILYSRTLMPTPRLADRGWFPVELALDAWQGHSVRLELSTGTDDPAGEDPLMGGWARPTLVARDAAPGVAGAVGSLP